MPRHLKLLALIALLSIISHHIFAQRIFWNEPNNNRIRFGTLTSTSLTGATNLLSSFSGISNITLDPNYNFIFFTEGNGSTLQQADYNGANPFELEIYGSMSEGTDIAYSANANGVYSTLYFEAGGITFIPESTGGPISLSLNGQSNDVFSCIAVDDGSERIYVFDTNDGTIYYSSFADDGLVPVASGYGNVVAMDFDEATNKLVFANEANQIWICDANGANADLVTTVAGGNPVTSLVYYSGYNKIYFVSNERIWSTSLDGLNVVTMMTLTGTGVTDIGVEPDQTLPTISSRYPADNQTGITAGETFTLDFTESVRMSADAGIGSQIWLRLFKTAGNVPVDTLDRSDPRLSFSGATLTITGLPINEPLTEYYILIGNRVIEDQAGNNFVGLSLTTAWSFTTAADESKYFSRQSGSWHDVNTWSHEGHGSSATPVSSLPGTGADVEIGAGHTVTMLDNASVVAANTGLVIQTGGALDMNNLSLNLWGDFRNEGTLLNGGILSGFYDIYSTELPIFQRLDVGVNGLPDQQAFLHTDIVAYDGVISVDGGVLNANGFQVCTPPSIPTSPVVTNLNSASVNLAWSPGAGDAFIILRNSASSSSQPKFKLSYTSNAAFESGTDVGSLNYAIYQGTANNVTITGLDPATSYDVDMYGFNNTIGGCYSLNNYQAWNFTTCNTVAAVTNPVSATYCTGGTKPAIKVDNPGSGMSVRWYDAATGGNLVPGDLSGGAGRGEVFIPAVAYGTFYAEKYDGTTGCASDTRVAVTLTALPAITPGTPSVNQNICSGGDPAVINGGTATGGDGNFTYQWSSSSTSGGPYNEMASAVSATYDPPANATLTTYYVRTVFSSTCSIPGPEVAVTVVANPLISADPAGKAVCGSEPSSFRVLAIGTTLTYQWQVDNGTGFTNVSNGGVYSGATTATLSIANSAGMNGYKFQCVVTESASCSVTSGAALLTVNTLPAAIDVPIADCETDAGSGAIKLNLLDYNDDVTGNDATANVVWYDNSSYTTTVPAPDNVSAANGRIYYPRVFGGNLCTDDAQLTVTVKSKPVVSPAPNNKTICSGTSTALNYVSTPSGAAYAWTISANNKITGAASGNGASINQTLTNTAATQQQITYTITPSLNGCVGPNFIQNVFVDPVPTIFNITGGGNICAGGVGTSVSLSGSQVGVTYALYRDNVSTNRSASGSGNAIAFDAITQAGTYTIRASTVANCAGDMNGSAVVTISTVPTGTAVIAGLSQLCVGDEQTYTINGVAGATAYAWTLPTGTEAVTPSTAASITIRSTGAVSGSISVTPSNTCGTGIGSAIGSLGISSLPQPEIQIIAPEKIFAEESATFTYTSSTSILDEVWNFGDGNTSTETVGVNTYASGGDFVVSIEVMAQNGCQNTANITVNVSPVATLGDLAIKNVITANADNSNDFLYIENLEKFANNEVIVIDRWGAEVFRQKNYLNDWDFKKGGEYLPAGNYVCILKSDGKTYSRVVTVIKPR
jgi:gliding motility-associated-like protein